MGKRLGVRFDRGRNLPPNEQSCLLPKVQVPENSTEKTPGVTRVSCLWREQGGGTGKASFSKKHHYFSLNRRAGHAAVTMLLFFIAFQNKRTHGRKYGELDWPYEAILPKYTQGRREQQTEARGS